MFWCLARDRSGAMGAKSEEKWPRNPEESQGCPEIRTVPVATYRTGFLYISCPEYADTDFSSKWRVQTSKQSQVCSTEKERCFFHVKCVLPPTWLLGSYWSFKSHFRHPSSANHPTSLLATIGGPVSLGFHTIHRSLFLPTAGLIKNSLHDQFL